MGSLKFFCKTHQVSDCGGIDYGYLRHPMVALKVFCKDLWDKHDSSVERSSLPGRSILKKKVGKSSQIVDYLHFNGALLGTASAAENCSFPEISSEDNCIRLGGGGCIDIVLTKNRDCLSFFTNCALLLGPVPNLRKALHRHYHRYNDDDIHQTTEALSIISSIIRPGSSPSSSTFLTCTWSMICNTWSTSSHFQGFIQRHP